jgi:hypothetical protein
MVVAIHNDLLLVDIRSLAVMSAISQGKARLDELIIEKRHTVEESQKGMYRIDDYDCVKTNGQPGRNLMSTRTRSAG